MKRRERGIERAEFEGDRKDHFQYWEPTFLFRSDLLENLEAHKDGDSWDERELGVS